MDNSLLVAGNTQGQTSTDTQKLKRLIRSFERSVDAGKLTVEKLTDFNQKFEDLIRPYEDGSDFGDDEYLLYEMQALICSENPSEGDATKYLMRARSVMRPDQEFVSDAASTWLVEELEVETQAVATKQAHVAVAAKKDLKRRRVKAVLVVSAVVACFALFQPVSDQLAIWGADPSMVSLAQQAHMTRQGELLFLRADPQLDSDSQIVQDCGSNAAANNSNGFIEQGCYDPNANRIYIRQMPSQLASMEVVTSAYEMLHVAYQNQLDADNGSAVNQAIEANYSQINTADLNTQVANFAKTEPKERDLELFSLLATGYSDISPTLYAYYEPYFTDTSTVVSLNNQVEATFQNDQSQLTQLQNSITNDENLASTAYADSVGWANDGNAYEDNYNYNIYSTDIDNANSAVDQYNQILQQYNTLVTQYEGTQPVAQIQSVAEQSSQN